MGKYLNPVSAVEEQGERLSDSGFSDLRSQWEHYRALAGRKHLAAVCDRGIFKIAPLVNDFREYEEFRNQYNQGHVLTFKVYAITDEFLHTHM